MLSLTKPHTKAATRSVALYVVLALMLAAPTRAHAEPSVEALDLKARTHFAAGEYKEALDIYADLYARSMHPTFLRNIGRCYQNLGRPAQAISSFKEYLRKAKGLGPDQRAEVESFIREMEELQRKQEHAQATPVAADAAPAPQLEPAPRAAPPPSAPVLVGTPAPDAAPDDGAPIYGRWWFWTVLGVVAAGGVATALVLSRPDGTPTAPTTFTTKAASPHP